MSRRAWSRRTGLFLVALALGCGAQRSPVAPRNLVIVLIDTLRQDRVSAYGYSRQTSPFLDRLAREGARLDGRSSASWTKPAATSLLTGLHPLRHQVASGGDTLPPEVVTLAQMLSARGFSTAAISSNGWVSRAWGQDRGFQTFLPLWTMGYGRFPKAPDVNHEVARLLPTLRPPFFLFVHYLDPHMPYDPPTAWDGQPLPPELARLRPLGRADFDLGGKALPHELAEAASELYDGEIRAVDAGVEQLAALLQAAGRMDDTLWVVTADHGEEFLDHGQMGHGKTLYEEVVRVPLIVKGPGVQPGLRLGRAVLEDIAPTVLDLLRVEPQLPPGYAVDGSSFADALSGGPAPVEAADWLGYLEGEQGASVAILKSDLKLVLSKDPYHKDLFDLGMDGAERVNLLAAAPVPGTGPVGFDALATSLAGEYNDLVRRAMPRRSTTADSGLRDQLAALGYIKFFSEKGVRRAFPRRLVPADARRGGLRGWENRGAFVDCGSLVDLPEDQLLQGWFEVEPRLGGRWTAPEATTAFPAEPGSGELLLEGVSFRRSAARLRLRWNDVEVAAEQVAPGPFSIRAALPAPSDPLSPPLLGVEVEPPFHPAEIGSDDERVLGIFVTSLCRSGAEAAQRR